MEECAIPANHDFVPMDVGNSEPDRARVEIAHDETRQEPPPGLRQEAQNVLHLLYYYRKEISTREVSSNI